MVESEPIDDVLFRVVRALGMPVATPACGEGSESLG
jgi:hypothetical protein